MIDIDRIETCVMAAEPRFRTWSYITAAGEHLYRGKIEEGIYYLNLTDKVLGFEDRLDRNDPRIAEDYGGDEELWDIRKKIREAISLIRQNKKDSAYQLIAELDGFFFGHALRRTIECYVGTINPDFGVA